LPKYQLDYLFFCTRIYLTSLKEAIKYLTSLISLAIFQGDKISFAFVELVARIKCIQLNLLANSKPILKAKPLIDFQILYDFYWPRICGEVMC